MAIRSLTTNCVEYTFFFFFVDPIARKTEPIRFSLSLSFPLPPRFFLRDSRKDDWSLDGSRFFCNFGKFGEIEKLSLEDGGEFGEFLLNVKRSTWKIARKYVNEFGQNVNKWFNHLVRT